MRTFVRIIPLKTGGRIVSTVQVEDRGMGRAAYREALERGEEPKGPIFDRKTLRQEAELRELGFIGETEL